MVGIAAYIHHFAGSFLLDFPNELPPVLYAAAPAGWLKIMYVDMGAVHVWRESSMGGHGMIADAKNVFWGRPRNGRK